jgi:CHAT domain-containing protein
MSAPQPDCVSELAACRTNDAVNACLADHSDWIRPGVVEQLAEAVRQRVRVDVDEALRLAETAVTIAGKLGDSTSLGWANRAKANSFWYKGNLKGAVELFETAIGHFEEAGMPAEIGRTLSSCIQPLALLGEYERALHAAARARAIFLQLDDRWRLARLEINVANIHHRQDRFIEALATYERAYEQLLPHRDAEGLAAALHNMAVCLIVLNDFDRALETYHRAHDLCANHGMPLIAAQADYNIAYLYFLRGEYATALDGLRATRELCRTNGDLHHAALCDLDQSEIYVEMNLTGEAARLAAEAERQFQELGMGFESARAVVNLAIAAHQQRDAAKALDLFAKAAAIFSREGNQAWQATVNLYRALVLFETGGDTETASRLCGESFAFFESSGHDRRAILCGLLLARIAFASGALPEAAARCEAALRKLGTIEAPLLSYDAHLLLGEVQDAAGESHGAYQTYHRARSYLETLRSSLQREELKIAFLKNRTGVYEQLVGICLRRKGRAAAEEAFGYMEQAKSRALAELITGRGSPLGWRAPGPAGERIRSLRQELNWYYRRIEIEQMRPEGMSIAQIAGLRAEARAREDELLRLSRELSPNSESSMLVGALGAVTLDQLRSTLGPDAALVEYFDVAGCLVAAIVTAGDLELVQLAPAAQIASSIRMLDFQLSKARLQEFGRKQEFERMLLAATRGRLEELYRYVWAPLADKLRAKHVVVVPHGVLHYLPFHALWDGTQYLIDRFSLSYAPSASIYALCHQRKANSSGPSLLMGVADRNAPWIRQEIRLVAAAVPNPQVYVGRQATVNVLRESGPGSRFIHIAAHGTFRRDNAMFSSVRLADSHLTMYDLYELRLPVELLSLSGCGTGLNAVSSGDELLGLTRGLFAAGAKSLLLTLWDVHDQTTARFMSGFYKRLQSCSDKAAALRDAIRELRDSHPHPYYWAPFILHGKDRGCG